jgi:hypothetical protein
MRVLVVNGLPSSARGRQSAKEFYNSVVAAFEPVSKLDIDPPDFIHVHKSELDDYLFEAESEFDRPTAISRFDRVDFVFVNADDSALPWLPANRKLAVLIKMCFATNKCLFAVNSAALILAYMCATNGITDLNVVNGGGMGGNLASIKGLLITSKLKREMRKTDVFLDNQTGDFYNLDAEKGVWVPRGNCGMRLGRKEDHVKPHGSRANGYSADTQHQKVPQLYMNRKGERRCRVRVESATNWLLSDLTRGKGRPEFKVHTALKWNLDEMACKYSGQSYTSLADGDNGPLLIEFGNCIGASFKVSAAYPDTISLLELFAQKKFRLIFEHQHIDETSANLVQYHQPMSMQPSAASMARPTSAAVVRASAGPAKRGGRAKRNAGRSKHGEGRDRAGVIYPETSVLSGVGCRPRQPRMSKQGETTTYRTAHSGLAAVQKAQLELHMKLRRSEQVADSDSDSSSEDDDDSDVATIRGGGSNSALTVHAEDDEDLVDEDDSEYSDDEAHENDPAQLNSSNNPNRGIFLSRQVTNAAPVKVRRVSVRTGPVCNHKKFQKLAEHDKKQPGKGYYSVVNDGPYLTPYERERRQYHADKKKWTAGPMRNAIGKRTTHLKHAVPINAGAGPWRPPSEVVFHR